MKWKVVLRRDQVDGGYVATCPALPGCVSEGDTKKEAMENIREAIEGVLQVLNERARRTSSADELVTVEV